MCCRLFFLALLVSSWAVARPPRPRLPAELENCAVHLAYVPSRARFEADRGLQALPKNSRDPVVAMQVAAWLRWHQFEVPEILAILRRRNLAIPGNLLGDASVGRLLEQYRKVALERAEDVEAMRGDAALQIVRLLDSARFSTEEIADVLNQRKIACPKKPATDDETVEKSKRRWTPERVAELIASPARVGALYHPDFENPAKMAKTIAAAKRIREAALAQFDEAVREALDRGQEIDLVFAMRHRPDEEQNTLALALQYFRYRAIAEREFHGPFVPEGSPQLEKARELEHLADDFSEILQRSNARIVAKKLKSFLVVYDYDDLVQEGLTALQRAVNNYDVRHGVRPSTWFATSVRNAYLNLLTADTAKRRGGAWKNRSLEAMRESARNFWEPKDRPNPSPEALMMESEALALARRSLDLLDEREREVVELRFGLRDGRSWTLREIGEHYGLTGERIRNIESDALAKLTRAMRSVLD